LTLIDRSTHNHDLYLITMARSTKNSKKPSPPSVKAPVKKNPSKADATKARGAHDFQEVRTLIDLIKKNDLAVLEFEKGDFKITLKTPAGASGGATLIQGHAPASAPHSAPAAAPTVEKPAAEAPKSNYKEITSPMVGTFYASPSPDSPAFVEVGKTISAESVVCIIEAMKVMNEIKAEIAGKVVEIVAENGKPVQFGQVLFRVS
jgi:acetyl-CoA carboxylase biotin carboxyl carrier protein